jgi:Protein of unknown function (DUF2975)
MGRIDETLDTSAGRRRLTQPLGGLLTFLAAIAVLAIAAGFIASGFRSGGPSYAGLGPFPQCVGANINGVGYQAHGPLLAGLKPGVMSGVGSTVSVCVPRPDAGQRALVFLTAAPGTLVGLIVLALTGWLLWTVRREGPFTPRIAGILRFLGWFVLLGWVAAEVAQNLAAAYFLASVETEPVPVASDAFSGPSLLIPALAACTLLTLARIMRVGARMRDDLAGTV